MSGPLPWHLLPDSATAEDDVLHIAGVNVLGLAADFGTPLFVYDEQHIRARCREAHAAFGADAAYAAKAFLCVAMACLVAEEGLGIDVATGGELYVALRAGFPPERIVLHGNNKSARELVEALDAEVGRIVVDSFDELDLLERLVREAGRPPPTVLLRITPGVEAHTHEFIRTGQHDSKFGFGVASGAAAKAVERARHSPHLALAGIHCHIGSQVFRVESFDEALAVVAEFATAVDLPELSIGGGLGVAYVTGESAPTITEWADHLTSTAARLGLKARLAVEPGRAIVARAAVTLYTLGTIKHLAGVRTYLATDGGMSDNPRPVLYGSGYETFLPRRVTAARPLAGRLVGKHCESGDVLVADAAFPDDLTVGDVVATPVTGAYGLAMASNYNKVPRPAAVFVRDGDARVVVRRETYEDLVRLDGDA